MKQKPQPTDLPKSLRDGMVRFLALIWLSSAGELIHEIVLAMSHKLKISALSGIPFTLP